MLRYKGFRLIDLISMEIIKLRAADNTVDNGTPSNILHCRFFSIEGVQLNYQL